MKIRAFLPSVLALLTAMVFSSCVYDEPGYQRRTVYRSGGYYDNRPRPVVVTTYRDRDYYRHDDYRVRNDRNYRQSQAVVVNERRPVVVTNRRRSVRVVSRQRPTTVVVKKKNHSKKHYNRDGRNY